MNQFYALKGRFNRHIPGNAGRSISLDITPSEDRDSPFVIFLHGFKGFKDWGHFPLIVQSIAGAGFNCGIFNFSHNGTTTQFPADFVDLDAFAQNTFSIEIEETGIVVDYILNLVDSDLKFDKSKVYLIGHSRGGGIAMLRAALDKRIGKVASWASPANLSKITGSFNPESWKKDGRVFIKNSRTEQEMPLNFSLYEDLQLNFRKLNLMEASKSLGEKLLILHGTKDTSVSPEAARQLKSANTLAKLVLVDNADHTFGGRHPWDCSDLPEYTVIALNSTLDFFKTGSHE